MLHKIIITSDSFKGSLTSAQVGEAAASGIKEACPECRTEIICIADGGEGTAAILTAALDGYMTEVIVRGPSGKPVKAAYGITKEPDGEFIAIMDIAQASGLTLLDNEERNPLVTSTYGTGEMIADALKKGCRKFLIGLGGSATNDGGSGMLEALGYRFLDKRGGIINNCCGKELAEIADIDESHVIPQLREAEFTIACDVESVFYGPEGASFTFAPQKGADLRMTGILEKGMISFADVIRRKYGTDLSKIKGSGAAGGLGGAFITFLNATTEKGTDLILDTLKFDERIQGADLIITGEGRIDSQTSKGKAVSGVLKRAALAGIPVVALCGISDIRHVRCSGFKAILPICPRPQNEKELAEAMHPDTASENIRKTVSGYIRSLSSDPVQEKDHQADRSDRS